MQASSCSISQLLDLSCTRSPSPSQAVGPGKGDAAPLGLTHAQFREGRKLATHLRSTHRPAPSKPTSGAPALPAPGVWAPERARPAEQEPDLLSPAVLCTVSYLLCICVSCRLFCPGLGPAAPTGPGIRHSTPDSAQRRADTGKSHVTEVCFLFPVNTSCHQFS